MTTLAILVLVYLSAAAVFGLIVYIGLRKAKLDAVDVDTYVKRQDNNIIVGAIATYKTDGRIWAEEETLPGELHYLSELEGRVVSLTKRVTKNARVGIKRGVSK